MVRFRQMIIEVLKVPQVKKRLKNTALMNYSMVYIRWTSDYLYWICKLRLYRITLSRRDVQPFGEWVPNRVWESRKFARKRF